MSDDNDEFPGGPTNLEFWSLEIPPGKTIHAKIADIPNVFEIVHITGCALGDKPSKDPHVVKVVPTALDGSVQGEVALGTLQSGRTDQFPVDFGISRTTGFKHTGKSTVFLSGYLTRSYGSDDEYDMEDEDSESEDEEDEEAPDAIPLANGGIKGVQGVKMVAKPAAAAAAAAESESDDEGESDEDESDDEGESDEDEEDDEDEDKQGDEYDRRLGAKSFEGAGGSSSSSEEEGEDSGDPLDIDSDDDVAVVQYDAAGRAGGPAAMDVSDESDEDESDEGEDDDESDDEGESDQEQAQPTPAKPSGKRPQQQPLTPQPQQQAAKRQKGEGGAKLMPQSAPAKATLAKTAAAAAGGGGAEQQFLSALVAHLRQGGPTDLSHLAGKVSKPKELAVKYKAFLAQHPETFKLDGDKVSLNAK